MLIISIPQADGQKAVSLYPAAERGRNIGGNIGGVQGHSIGYYYPIVHLTIGNQQAAQLGGLIVRFGQDAAYIDAERAICAAATAYREGFESSIAAGNGGNYKAARAELREWALALGGDVYREVA